MLDYRDVTAGRKEFIKGRQRFFLAPAADNHLSTTGE
jgi:hypothetical protein